MHCTETGTALNKLQLRCAKNEATSVAPLTCFAFNSNYSLLIVGTASATVFCVNLETSPEAETPENEETESESKHSSVKTSFPNLFLSKQLHLNESSKGVSCIEFRPDDKLFVCSTWDCSLRYFSSSKKNKPLAVLDWHHSTVTSLKFYDNLLFSACKEGKIVCWDLYARN